MLPVPQDALLLAAVDLELVDFDFAFSSIRPTASSRFNVSEANRWEGLCFHLSDQCPVYQLRNKENLAVCEQMWDLFVQTTYRTHKQIEKNRAYVCRDCPSLFTSNDSVWDALTWYAYANVVVNAFNGFASGSIYTQAGAASCLLPLYSDDFFLGLSPAACIKIQGVRQALLSCISQVQSAVLPRPQPRTFTARSLHKISYNKPYLVQTAQQTIDANMPARGLFFSNKTARQHWWQQQLVTYVADPFVTPISVSAALPNFWYASIGSQWSLGQYRSIDLEGDLPPWVPFATYYKTAVGQRRCVLPLTLESYAITQLTQGAARRATVIGFGQDLQYTPKDFVDALGLSPEMPKAEKVARQAFRDVFQALMAARTV